jgi:hypothetical protein
MNDATISPAGDAATPAGDLLASPNFGICDTTRIITFFEDVTHYFLDVREAKIILEENDILMTIGLLSKLQKS